jgi:HK97 family phage portal protein
MKAERFTMTGQEAQTVEARNHQIEEVARAFGVPRPFLMMDDTSWGSGIEQLAIMFVRFGLNPGIVAWEQALRRVLLSTADRKRYAIDIDEHELLRGTMKDQAEFFSKALGGHPWLVQNEVREEAGYRDIANADTLKDPVGGKPAKETVQ